MKQVRKSPLPDPSFMQLYKDTLGCQVDCFCVEVPTPITMEQYITAFFDSPVFKLERFILKIAAKSPTTRQGVENLASGKSDQFAMWKVEQRSENELLLAVQNSPIRTWLTLRPGEDDTTHLYFGSAVLPEETDKLGNPRTGFLFRALGWFHEGYSKVLLWAAVREIYKQS
ncbi:hypothetical protein GUA87_06980 [Sneathiella sp. P13V-1]|uniref:hypothetical protein n=1 Tax=Sneathiella sp. P13V-1 TaxID=2697366 RepID=UPI00187B4BA0|nr:hypothetical protein [Sneathiella sp. P13V-1]MBE7636584.1 hypothetical protein [Sneathiella sp. P13V-1]